MEGTTKFTQITIPGSGDDGRKIQSPTQPDGRQKKKLSMRMFTGFSPLLMATKQTQIPFCQFSISRSSSNATSSVIPVWTAISWASTSADSFSSAAYKIFLIASAICQRFVGDQKMYQHLITYSYLQMKDFQTNFTGRFSNSGVWQSTSMSLNFPK